MRRTSTAWLRHAAGGRATGRRRAARGGAPPGHAEAGAILRRRLAPEFGADVDLRIGATVAFGDDDGSAPPEPDARLRIALFDFGALPEDESQGRLLDALRGPQPLLAVADEAAFRRRFGALPERAAERRAAWQRLADRRRVLVCCTDLSAPAADPGAAAAVQQALARWSA